MLLVDSEDPELIATVIAAMLPELPAPKKKNITSKTKSR